MSRRQASWVTALAVVALLLSAAGATGAWSMRRQVTTLESGLASLRSEIARPAPSPSPVFDAQQVADSVKESVVTVFAGRYLGSGFAFGEDGGRTIIVTNYHVVAGANGGVHRSVTIQQSGNDWPGEVVNFDPDRDIALIAIAGSLPALESAYEQDNAPRVGDSVLAYGSPEGLEGTATVGIISALRGDWIHTDAQINHGNSGGPLVNGSAEVLGITSLGFVGGGSGLGFALDIRQVCILDSALVCS